MGEEYEYKVAELRATIVGVEPARVEALELKELPLA
jgi:hypothetical protein